MLPTNETLSIDFTINYDGHTFNVGDTFDFTGLDLTRFTGLIKLTDPAGTIVYNNTVWGTPDIDHNTSLESAFITLIASVDPVTNKLLPGDYVVQYQLRYNYTVTGVTIGEILATTGDELGETKIELEGGDYTDLQEDDSIVITGSAANDDTYTVVDVEYADPVTWVYVSEVLVISPDDTGTVAFEIDRIYLQTFTYCLNFTKPVVDLVVTHDCDYLKLIGKDQTLRTGDTLLTRTMKVIYPSGVDGNPVEDTLTSTSIISDTLTAPVLYTKKYTFTMTSTNSSLETDGLIVLYTAEGTQDHEVICDSNLVNLKACLISLYGYYSADCEAGVSSKYACTVQQIDNLRVLGAIAAADGDADAVAGYVNDIKELVECAGIECDCCVSDEVPVKVVSTVFTWTDDSKQDKLTGDAGSVFYIDSNGDMQALAPGTDGQVIEWRDGLPVNIHPGNYIVNHQANYNLPTEAPAFTIPANYFVEDGDGLEFLYSVRNSSGAFSVAVKSGVTDYAAIAIGSVSQGSGRGTIVKSGTDLTVYHVSDHPAILIASGTISGLDFTVDNNLQVYQNAGTVGAIVGLIVRKLKLIV